VGQGPFIVKSSRSHSDTPHSVELFRTSDQSVAGISSWPSTTLKTERHPYRRWDSNPKSQQQVAADSRGHWDRHLLHMRRDICKEINIWGYTYSSNTYDYNFLLMCVSSYWHNCLDTFLTDAPQGGRGAEVILHPFFRLYSLVSESRFYFVFQPRHKGKYWQTYVCFRRASGCCE